MAQQIIHAVYESGRLRPLEPIDLVEGQRVTIAIQTAEVDAIRVALGDLVRWADTSDDSDAGLEMLADEIDNAYQGEPPLSQIIIEDRGDR